MNGYTRETAQRLAQLLRDADAANKQNEAHPNGPIREWPEWYADYLLASGKLTNLFLTPNVEVLRDESTEAGGFSPCASITKKA
ncbi:MAG TPA: hypothetical protein VNE63_21310 [Candidatus Acidoferrales bacterium]|nr:hypothetical protein [Candidatus Acidoferrales bacterium]